MQAPITQSSLRRQCSLLELEGWEARPASRMLIRVVIAGKTEASPFHPLTMIAPLKAIQV